MPHSLRLNIYKNVPNIVSILGVLPLIVLFTEDGYQYLIPLIIYNNIMDDLDGILAGKLNVRSAFGARLDNVCDAISHTIIVMVIGLHHGWICGLIGLIAISAILVRSVSRLDPDIVKGTGSPTNELIRHILFVILLASIFDFDPHPDDEAEQTEGHRGEYQKRHHPHRVGDVEVHEQPRGGEDQQAEND